MRFIPAVSGVQIPPLLPEYDRKPGNFPGFFCYGLFCRVSRDAGQRPARPAGPSWKGGATGEGMSRPGSPAGGLPHTAIVWGIAAVPGWEVSRAISPGETATAQILQAGPFAGVFLLAGRKYRKSLPKESKFCRCISALWKIHKALWQGSSVGQSMRFIPAVSGVQIPPLLPETHKRFGSVPDRFFVMAVSCSILRSAGVIHFLHLPASGAQAVAGKDIRMRLFWSGSETGMGSPHRQGLWALTGRQGDSLQRPLHP